MANGEETTGTTDENYNLISILYHMLEGAETYELYAEDADEADDQELAGFFREVQNTNRQLAERAKDLLKQRLS